MNTNTSFELLVKAYKALVAQSEAASHKEALLAARFCESVIDEVDAYFQAIKPIPTGLTKAYACSNVFKSCQYTLTPLGLNDMRCVGCKFKRVA